MLAKTLTLAAVAAFLVVLGPANATTPPATCHYRIGGALPDTTCTPGATNPAVVQGDINVTICKTGWTTIVRPPLKVTEPEKYASMRAYGVPTTAGHAGLYEYDHLIPLELGGAVNDQMNLWPEPHHVTVSGKDEGSYVKDGVEAHLHSLVCHGKMTLAAAQSAIAHDWRTTD